MIPTMKARRILLPLVPTNLNEEIDIDKEWQDNIHLLISCLGKTYVHWLITYTENEDDHDQEFHGNCKLQDHRRI